MKKIDLENENQRLMEKINKLQRENDYAVSELVELSQGLGNKPYWYTDAYGWDTAMKHKAGLAIKKLLEMRK